MEGKIIIKGIYSGDLCNFFLIFRRWRGLNQDLFFLFWVCGGATVIFQHLRTKFQVGTNWEMLQNTNRTRLPRS